MKLYTEEQVRDMLSGAMRLQWIEEFLLKYKPITLPSDEEILAHSLKETTREYKAFQRGAKWMREQIQESFEHLWEELTTITPADLMSNIIPSYHLHNFVRSSETSSATKCKVCGLESWQHYKIK